jgi:hypothetical protein
LPWLLAVDSTGNNNAARIAMMATTIRSSMRVKPLALLLLLLLLLESLE